MGKKILRDPTNGRVLPGTAPLNPSGRPVKKRDILDKKIKQFYGPECEQLLLDIIEISQYDSKIDFNNTKPNERRFFKSKFTNQQIVDARKFLFEQFWGKPVAEVHNEITTPEDTNIKVTFIKNKKDK